MDAVSRRRDGHGSADEDHWASEDISVLHALLETPRRHGGDDSSPVLSWASSNSSADDEDNEDTMRFESTVTAKGRPFELKPSADASEVVVTALKRQVQLLQQEYDRHLELRVAKSVVAAGGRSAPRASTIRLYRQYERLARVAASLESENQRLSALLADRQQQSHRRQPSPAAPGGRRDEAGETPFRVALLGDQDAERIPRRTARGMFDADAKQPAARRPHEREEMPGSSSSSGEEK